MDVTVHSRSERLIYHAVTLQQALPAKGLCHQHDAKVTAPAFRAGVPRVLMAFITDLQV